jgi:hypothetical protein
VRPELEKAQALVRQFKEAAPETPVIFTVHELKRLARFTHRRTDQMGSELS